MVGLVTVAAGKVWCIAICDNGDLRPSKFHFTLTKRRRFHIAIQILKSLFDYLLLEYLPTMGSAAFTIPRNCFVEQSKVLGYWGSHFVFISKLLLKFLIVFVSFVLFCMHVCFCKFVCCMCLYCMFVQETGL